KLDVPALENAIAEIVRRHEVLRTVFPATDGQPAQVVKPPERNSIELLDLSALPIAERESRARQIINGEAERPFDLSQGPLYRVTLLRLAEEEHALLIAFHHIVF